MKSYIVIGLGRFGAELATRLYACGEEVMVIDTNEQLIDKIADRVTRAVAADARDADVLKKLGADKVVIPEREVADKLALGLTHAGVMEYIELSQEFGIVEMEPISAWVGKTIRELELRNTYGVNVIAVRSQEDTIKIPPDIDTPIPADVVMVMLGKYEMFENLKRK